MTDVTQEPGLDAAGLELIRRIVRPMVQERSRQKGDAWDKADDALGELVRAYEAHRSGAGEPVAWRARQRKGPRRLWELFYREPSFANDPEFEVEPLYASPAKAGELDGKLKTAMEQEEKSRLQSCDLLGQLVASEARARRKDEALREARDFIDGMSDTYNFNCEDALTEIDAALSDSPASADHFPDAGNMVAANAAPMDLLGDPDEPLIDPASAARPAVTDALDDAIYFIRSITRSTDKGAQAVIKALEAVLSQTAPASMNGTQGEAE